MWRNPAAEGDVSEYGGSLKKGGDGRSRIPAKGPDHVSGAS